MKLDPGIHIVMHSVLSLKPGVTPGSPNPYVLPTCFDWYPENPPERTEGRNSRSPAPNAHPPDDTARPSACRPDGNVPPSDSATAESAQKA